MQPPNSLIALGVSAVVAASAIGVSPAAAEPGISHRQSPAKRETTQTNLPSEPAPDSANAASSSEQPSPAHQPDSAASSSEPAVSLQDSDALRRSDQLLDRFQTETRIQQRLNQSQFRTYDRPLSPQPNPLQMEQMMQQISLPDAQNPAIDTNPSRTLDRLQFEQRVRQRLQAPEPQSAVSAQPAASTTANAPDHSTNSTGSETPAATSPAEASPPLAQTSAAVESPSEAKSRPSLNPTSNQAEHQNQPTESAWADPPVAEPQPRRVSRGYASRTARTRAAANSPAADQAEASPTEPAAATEATANQTDANVPQPTESAESAEPMAIEPSPESGPDPDPESAVSEAVSEPVSETVAETTATDPTQEAAQAEPTATEASATDTVAEAPTSQAEAEQETNVTPEAEAQPVDRETRRKRRQARRRAETAQTETQTETAPTETIPAPVAPPTDTTPPPADSLPTIPFDPNPTDGQTDGQAPGTSLIPGDNEPAPEYLDPNPNPLAFPTEADEVELVGTQPITLRQAVELALRNNSELRQAQFQLERAQAQLRERLASNLPTLDANARFEQSGTENVVRSPETTGVDPTTGEQITTGGDLVRNYQDSTLLGTGIQLNYNVFTSGRRPALIEAAQSQVRLQQLDIERQTEQLILETTGDYYDLQQAGAQVNIFSANLAQAEQSLRDAQALERAGVGTRFDVLQAEVDVANARQRLTQQLSDLEVARRQLAQRLNISQTVNVSAADPIEVAGVWDLGLEESIVQAYKNRVELEQQLVQREISQQERRAALAQLGPQVSFVGNFNVTNNLDNDAFLDSFGYNYSLALQASLALFDGGLARAQANQAESNISIAEAEFENVQDQIRLDVERGFSQLNASFANIQTTALAVEQATEALRLARLRFQAGVGTQTDVLRQQAVLAEAQVNNLSAILDYNRALAVLRRAVSNYPEGFLNDQP
ncbi:TolC family protein [Leptolyngbya sp. NK1-12]|uniref:TolC family protein n=1 Tax=Leptolyngbya sp. NK1-12 TaxID=2547451 RepID=A0AA96WIC2_9CYAN|nr:TolC family protein [Leptolyngbya sp. NK1-12]